MNSIPNIKQAQAQAHAEAGKPITIICCQCRAPLWSVTDMSKYGTRWSAVKTPFPGVPPYEEYWDKDQRTAFRTDCPKCMEPYFKVLKCGDMMVPKISTLELDS